MAGTLMPVGKHQFFDNNGDELASGKLFTYEAGTTTKLATYSDSALTTANANPIVLDSAGRATVFLQAASYKFTLAPATDTDPPVSAIWTVDNVDALGSFLSSDVTGTAGEALSANDFVYLSDGSGGLTAGRFYKTDADNLYSSTTANVVGVAPSAIASGSSGSIRLTGRVTGFSSLTAGTKYYLSATAGAITSSAPTNARIVAAADTTTSVILTSVENANTEVSGTAGENIAAGDVVIFSDGSGGLTINRWYQADGDVAARSKSANLFGFAPVAITSGNAGTIRIGGVITGLSGLTAGTLYYASGTAGGVTATVPSFPRIVGVADTTTSIIIGNGVDPGGRLNTNVTAVGNVGAGEDDLMTYSLAGGSLAVNLQSVRIRAWGTTTVGAGSNKTLKVYFGSTAFTILPAANYGTNFWTIEALVVRTSATAQTAHVQIVYVPQSAPSNTSGFEVRGTAAETLSGAVTIKLTGESVEATNDIIVQHGMQIELLP